MEFFDYYEKLFGDRWPALLESLKGEGCAMELRFGEGLEPYFLDEASVFAAKALGVEPGDDVLDMCAAPGGKTLVIASQLNGEGSLQSNDRSPDRRLRLQHVIENSLPENWRSVIKVTGYDGMKFGLHKKECFDKVLLDAPCSSDRHVLNSPAHLRTMKPPWQPSAVSGKRIVSWSIPIRQSASSPCPCTEKKLHAA